MMQSNLLQLFCVLCIAILGIAERVFGDEQVAKAKPLRIFILAGQSNMQGHAHVRTFEHLGMDPASKPLLDVMQKADGSPMVCERVWITSIGSAETEQIGKLTIGYGASQNGPKIGPEYTFGITMEQLVDGPILLIKTAWGGKSLNTDFRSPSAGPYVFNENQLAAFQKQGKDVAVMTNEKEKATGVNYRLIIEHVKRVLADIKRVVPDYDDAQGFELSGFVWFQGWNDMVDSSTYPKRDQPGGYDAYSDAMAHFIRDVRRDLNVPELPFVIGVLGVGGPVDQYGPEQQRYKAIHQNFRMAMAAPASYPEFKGTVAALWTEKYWDRELSDAKAKEDGIKQQVKKLAAERNLSPADQKQLLERMMREGMSDCERQVIEKGISNLEFHYLGSAKILGGIGRGLAETMWTLVRHSQQEYR